MNKSKLRSKILNLRKINSAKIQQINPEKIILFLKKKKIKVEIKIKAKTKKKKFIYSTKILKKLSIKPFLDFDSNITQFLKCLKKQ